MRKGQNRTTSFPKGTGRWVVVTGDPKPFRAWEQACASQGLVAVLASSGAAARRAVQNDSPVAVVVISQSPRHDGPSIVGSLKKAAPEVPIIVVAERDDGAAIRPYFAWRVHDVLPPDPGAEEISAVIARLRTAGSAGGEADESPSRTDHVEEFPPHAGKPYPVQEAMQLLRRQVERPYQFDDLVGGCPPMQRVFELINQIAEADVPVLIQGATGTGKELVARSLHVRSRRARGPFVPVDCGAIPDNLLESEFFGHEKGAFTGAEQGSIGLLEYASGGTFFLDELGELPLPLQAKLLRTLQEKRVRRLGGRRELPVDVRVVAATARNLEEMLARGEFRQDLFYRVNVVRIVLPPLCERGDDIGLLAEHFAYRASREMGREPPSITPEAYQVLRAYSWPGNVRQLQNVIRRAIALTKTRFIEVDNLPPELVASAGDITGGEAQGYFQLRDRHLKEFEYNFLRELLARHRGNVKLAATEAKLPRGTLYRLMKNHGLDSDDFRN